MNLLLEHSKCVQFYTYLDPIFDLEPRLEQFTYLISDLETAGQMHERLSGSSLIIPGKELHDIVVSAKVQFVWAVISAFDYEPTMPAELPYADGNTGLWTGSPKPQADGARFEIVCWDSGATLFIGIDAAFGQKLRMRYPDIRDLDDYSRTQG